HQTPRARTQSTGEVAGDSIATVVHPQGTNPGAYSDERVDWQSNSVAETMQRDFDVPTKSERPSVQMLAQSTVRERPFNVATTPDAPSATLQGVDWDVPSIQPTPAEAA